MKTKKIITGMLIISVFLLAPLALWAQGGMGPGHQGRMHEKMEAQRIAYLTKKLDLTPKEAEKFWPVFNQHHDQMKEKSEAMQGQMELKPEDIATMSDDEAEKALDSHLNTEKEMLQARHELLTNLKEILPARKVLLFIDAEKGFRMEMMRSAAKRRPGGRNR